MTDRQEVAQEVAALLRAQGLELPPSVLEAVEVSYAAARPALDRLRRQPVPLGPGYVEPHDGLAWIAAGGRSARAAATRE